jgi:hypothetical protein
MVAQQDARRKGRCFDIESEVQAGRGYPTKAGVALGRPVSGHSKLLIQIVLLGRESDRRGPDLSIPRYLVPECGRSRRGGRDGI